MKKFAAFLACACALVLVSHADVTEWFDGGLETGWPNYAEGGVWTSSVDQVAVTDLASYHVGTLTLEAADADLLFKAGAATDAAENSVSVTSTLTFEPFEATELPEIPDQAKGAICLAVTDDDPAATNFYGVAKDPTGSTNVWTALSGGTPVNGAVSVTMNFKKDAGTYYIQYVVGSTVLNAGLNDGWLEIVSADASVQLAGYRGAGTVSSLSATYTPNAPATVSFTVTAPTHATVVSVTTNNAPVALIDDKYTVAADAVVKVTYQAANGYEPATLTKEFSNITESVLEPGEDVTPTAIQYTIAYDLAGSGLLEGVTNPTAYAITNDTFTLNNPTNKTGYLFAGWTNAEITVANPTVTITQGSTGNRQYFSVFTAEVYTITYVLGDGGVNGEGNPATYTIESATITLANPTREGYTFVRWTEGDTIAAGSTGNKTFTAEWELVPVAPSGITFYIAEATAGTDFTNVNVVAGFDYESLGTYAQGNITATFTVRGKVYAGVIDWTAKTIDFGKIDTVQGAVTGGTIALKAGGAAFAGNSAEQSVIAAQELSWISESGTNHGGTGTWSDGTTYSAEGIAVNNGTFTANNCSTGDVVEIVSKMKFVGETSTDGLDVSAMKAGLILGKNTNEAFIFRALANGAWNDIATSVFAPTVSDEYTVRILLNYNDNTVRYSIIGANGSETVLGSFANDMLMGSAVSGLEFKGEGVIAELRGTCWSDDMAVDANGVRYDTLAQAVASGVQPITLLWNDVTEPAGWSKVQVGESNVYLLEPSDPEACIGDIKYVYLTNALEIAGIAAAGEDADPVTVTLLKDFTVSTETSLEIPENVVLDCDEKSFTFSGEGKITFATNSVLVSSSPISGYATVLQLLDGPDGYVIGETRSGDDPDFLYTYAMTTAVYTITYDLDGGSVETPNPTSYTIETATFTLVNPTKENSEFLGWSGTDITGMTNEVIIAAGSTGAREYTANWKVITPPTGFIFTIAEGTEPGVDFTNVNVQVKMTYEDLGSYAKGDLEVTLAIGSGVPVVGTVTSWNETTREAIIDFGVLPTEAGSITEATVAVREKSGGASVDGASGDVSVIAAQKLTWITESVATYENTGAWVKGATKGETVIEVNDASFVPKTVSNGSLVEIITEACFDGAVELPTDTDGMKASVAIVDVGGTAKFAVLSNGEEWVTTEVPADVTATNKVKIVLDYSAKTVAYSVFAGAKETSLGVFNFDADAMGENVTKIDFNGSGKIKSLNGDFWSAALATNGNAVAYLPSQIVDGMTLLWDATYAPTKAGTLWINKNDHDFYLNTGKLKYTESTVDGWTTYTFFDMVAGFLFTIH